ncbi:hypothetical protein PGO_061670 [Plasmodium gonderi]|uniref:Uncharacterized protein n=1 Tax=Plasmodium gonderi TaxID=77519 RepID=A0A1Y1JGZ0_PLAGO|nr:hypothetical protein PGO_061670 [Plasmodium gonderi]GAW80022.1 hypothetical protein PGO_061670 [Plasmodium gonderi]
MNDFIHEDIELKRRAWVMHFSQRRTNNKFKFTKNGNKKYVTTWVKEKDENGLFERWVKQTQLNEKYIPINDHEEGSEKAEFSSNVELNRSPTKNLTRRSYRINLQNILDKEFSKKCYVDPPSDFSMDEKEEEEKENYDRNENPCEDTQKHKNEQTGK